MTKSYHEITGHNLDETLFPLTDAVPIVVHDALAASCERCLHSTTPTLLIEIQVVRNWQIYHVRAQQNSTHKRVKTSTISMLNQKEKDPNVNPTLKINKYNEVKRAQATAVNQNK